MTESLFDVTGKTALVTGASSGFGEHFARVLAEYGARVVVGARRKDRLDALVKEITDTGGEAHAVSLDVTDSSSVKAAFDSAEEIYGGVNIVANNAGVEDSKMATEIDEESWDYVLNTNLRGAWLVASEAGRRMISAKRPGSIVNTASITGLRPSIMLASYSTSKAAVIHLTKNLALEWCRTGIRVNALCPGYFMTELTQAMLTSDMGQTYIAGTPSKRTGELHELTAPFMLLASEAGSFINGIALPVDGAHLLGNM